MLLLLGWAAIAVAVLVTGSLTTSFTELRRAVESGAVTRVSAERGFDDSSVTAYGVQEVRWRDGLVERRTEVAVASPGERTTDTDLPFAGLDVVPQLRALAPGDLAVSAFESPYSSSSAFGFQVPTALGLLAAAWWICSITLLAGGPEPFWATRWAWSWLSLLPGGVVACLVLSGPAPLLPSQRPGSRRLTGGWALLAVVVVHQLS